MVAGGSPAFLTGARSGAAHGCARASWQRVQSVESPAVPHLLDSLSHYSRRQRGANLIVAFICGGALGAAGALTIARMTSDRDLELVRVVRDLAADSFVGEVDEGTLVDDALTGMIGSLDRYSRYYRPEEIEALDAQMQENLHNIEAIIGKNGQLDLSDAEIINLSKQIQANTSTMTAFQEEVLPELERLRQAMDNILAGKCSNGQAIREILSDGTLVCESGPLLISS